MKDVVHRHAASPLSRLRPGEQNNKVSQPPEACRRKLDHLYAISTSSPPLGGVFIVAYFCRQYNQELQLSPLKTAKSLPAARLFPQETSAANAVCLYAPPVKKGIPERPQTLRYPEIKNHFSAEYAQSATTTTAASGGNREELLGQRPARRECRPRHEADAGCRNPEAAEHILNRLIRWEAHFLRVPAVRFVWTSP